jgi:uncharacterized protein (TIGR02118 family)
MIRMSVLYPTTEGYVFDHDYYRDRHVPLALGTWGLERAEIDKGVNGPYVAAVHFQFDSLEDMNAALAAEGSMSPTTPTSPPSCRSARSSDSGRIAIELSNTFAGSPTDRFRLLAG